MLFRSAIPLLVLTAAAPVAQAIVKASDASFPVTPDSQLSRLKLYALTAMLHVLQPLARLSGRLDYGLSPWRRR